MHKTHIHYRPHGQQPCWQVCPRIADDRLGWSNEQGRLPQKASPSSSLRRDLKNGGILGVTSGVEEAAAKIGWDVRVLDGAGSIQGPHRGHRSGAWRLQPDGLIINGFDAVEQQAALEGVVAAGNIPMVAWHSGPKIGCDAPGGIFANVSTDAMTVSEVAADMGDEGWRRRISVRDHLHRLDLSDRHRQG